MFPARSKIEFAAGLTVMVSTPLAGESKAIPIVYTLSSPVILGGVAELKPAVPPDIESTKSDASSSPVPLETA